MSLSIQNLSILTHNGTPLLSNCSLSVNKGEILSVMGPSGCGKSTLLNVIAGHLSGDFNYSGSIEVNNKTINKIASHERKVGILFQEDLLFPHLCIWENLAFALPDKIKGSQRKVDAINALKNVQLDSLANVFPDQISGGQRARISLVRMLLAKPDVALLDEPFSKLDKALRIQFRDWVFEQLIEANIPTLLVTHDIDDIPKESQTFLWPMEINHA
ncbi:ATP-binding cassette domain-containing protein [Aliivibrio sifiae]|uniref:ABC transporter ATP-binding protein n=1 Tax=Aliivibrio sifiae TaxID=566293 RepID=A0A2S7XF87_9GAMM|nr:ATP-binding cassette domain-containing protein [Aliivibrio sifiae]PQJ89937.1 ABC transporter ATP-binding protein [Aliivibrio sifiae]